MRKLLFALRARSDTFKIKDFNSEALDHACALHKIITQRVIMVSLRETIKGFALACLCEAQDLVQSTSMEKKRSTRLSRAKPLGDHDQPYPCFIV